MAKRKARARREDPRTWTQEEYVRRRTEELRAGLLRDARRRIRRDLASPFVDTCLNMENVRAYAAACRNLGVEWPT